MGKNKPCDTYECISEQIKTDYPTLSNRLQKIAKFALDHPTDIAIETIATLAKRADVQPSALIRFAKAFGYSGFSEMQRAFQSRVVAKSASYKERIREIELTENENQSEDSLVTSLLNKFCSTNIYSLEQLQEKMTGPELEQALNLLDTANNIFVTGQRRSFPVATYLAYALNHAGNRTFLLDGVGGLLNEHASAMRADDLLIAITYAPYANETASVINAAKQAGSSILLITDSNLSPAAELANVTLVIFDAEVHSFKSLSASMCISQVLSTSLAFRNKDKSNQ